MEAREVESVNGSFFSIFLKKMKKMALYDMAKRKEKGISNGNNIIYNESKKNCSEFIKSNKRMRK